VVEDRFPSGRPAWECFGATMVADVGPFEDMKLRLLNGAHSAIAYLGLLGGHATVDRAFADPAIRRFVDALWAEAVTTLRPDLDTAGYTAKLSLRFANAALAHRTAQIANDGSQKLPQRVVASALERLKAGAAADHLMLVVAAWIAACDARGKTLPAGHFTDPLDAALEEIATQHLSAADTARAVFELAGFAAGEEGRDRLTKCAAAHLEVMRCHGISAALAALEHTETRS